MSALEELKKVMKKYLPIVDNDIPAEFIRDVYMLGYNNGKKETAQDIREIISKSRFMN